MDDLIEQWEEAARHADAISARLQEFIDAGMPVPSELLDRLAVAEEAVLMKMVSIQHSRRPRGELLH